MDDEQSLTKSRLWLVYFPRAAHHLFMRMLSCQPNLEMIEVLTHLAPVVPQTIRLSSNETLNEAREECEILKQTTRQGVERWMRDIDNLEHQGKRVLNSYSVAFHISPAAHNRWLNHWRHEKSGSLELVSPSINGEALTSDTDKMRIPSSLPYWHLEPSQTSKTNPTIFSDSFLRSHIPIFLIRHPALAFPSTIRVASEYFNTQVGDVFMNLILRYKWHKILYDWYMANRVATGNPPVVVLDADDLMYNPQAVEKLCSRTGLDPELVKYEWNANPNGKLETTYENEDVFLNTLAASSGVVKGKGSDGVEIDVEAQKWKLEFGVQRATMLEKLVRDAMKDYDYLRARSIGEELR